MRNPPPLEIIYIFNVRDTWLQRRSSFRGSEGDAAIRAVLNEQASIDLALVQRAFLKSVEDDCLGLSGLLEQPNLESATTAVVVRQNLSNSFQWGRTLGEINLERAEACLLAFQYRTNSTQNTHLFGISTVTAKFDHSSKLSGDVNTTVLFRSSIFQL